MKILQASANYRSVITACMLAITLAVAGCASLNYSAQETALQRRVQDAIRTSSAGSGTAIQVVVNNGTVTLHGSVSRGIDKTLIGKAAGSVEGVVKLNNYVSIL